jgi:hypothetical protein
MLCPCLVLILALSLVCVSSSSRSFLDLKQTNSLSAVELVAQLRSGELNLLEYISSLCDQISLLENDIRALLPDTFQCSEVRSEIRNCVLSLCADTCECVCVRGCACSRRACACACTVHVCACCAPACLCVGVCCAYVRVCVCLRVCVCVCVYVQNLLENKLW